jgi:hypothetical protein
METDPKPVGDANSLFGVFVKLFLNLALRLIVIEIVFEVVHVGANTARG